MTWQPGQVVEHRHLAGTRVAATLPVHVVLDTPELFATYLPGGAPVTYLPGPWPTATGHHPWHPQARWSGHGVLQLQRPADPYGVWVFWEGAERRFAFWYLNIHDHVRDETGWAIRDLELDVVVRDGVPRLKYEQYVDLRVAEGRFTQADADHARAVADDLVGMVERGEQWWDESWARWAPPAGWDRPG